MPGLLLLETLVKMLTRYNLLVRCHVPLGRDRVNGHQKEFTSRLLNDSHGLET